MNLFEQIPTSHYRPLRLSGITVYEKYDLLNGFIQHNVSDSYRHILAKPFTGNDIVKWYTTVGGTFKTLDDCTVAQREQALKTYHLFLQNIRQKISELQQRSDGEEWSELLKLVFNESVNIVYTNGTEIVILWGWHFGNEEENKLDEKWLLVPQISEIQPSEIPEETSDSPVQSFQDQPHAITELSENEHMSGFEKKIIVRSNKKQRSKDRFISRFWWVLLFLLGLLYLMYLFYFRDDCRTNNNAYSDELRQILPADPSKRLPIDTTKIIVGDSGTSKIISNLVNIALKDKTKDPGQFAIDLKKAFPDSAYKIVYFDSATSRLQFQFPDSIRKSVKEQIRNKMNGYELLIWDESIFKNVKIFNDPIFSDPDKSWYLNTVHAPQAWELTTGDSSVAIAVIDDGFDLSHPDLKKPLKYPYNVKTANNTITSGANRIHGTHVAGIATGLGNNGKDIAGIASGCSLMPIQIADDRDIFTSSDVIDGLLYAIRHGANVVNMSLGRVYPDELASQPIGVQESLAKTTDKDEEYFWNELFDYADKENVTIVVASGNQHVLVGIDPMQRSEKIVKVSAIDKSLKQATFSNFGDKVTVYAPGEKIYSLIPGNQCQFMDGTSMASPIVAGAVALLKCRNRKITNSEILQKIKSTSDPLTGIKGAGLIRVDKLLQ